MRWLRVLSMALTLLVCVVVLSVGVSAQGFPRALPPDFTEVLYSSGFNSATTMTFAPDGRLFVAEQSGDVLVVPAGGGNPLPAPFVSLNVDSSGERGVLGLAFHPNFASNGYVYIYYTTTTSPRRNRISRFKANGNVAVDGSEKIIVELNDLSGATNHNGGAIHFGSDGKLYVAVGDNASGDNAQSMTTRHGKILRYNPNGTIPTTNPFYNTTTGANRAIWALGLRNPYTFDVHPDTGVLFINDVGQGSWEEINQGFAGANFGWPVTEGDFNQEAHPTFTRPRYAYNQDNGECAITGGAFYNPAISVYPAEYVGDYFFTDFCGGWIRYFDPSSGAVNDFGSDLNASFIVDLEIGMDARLYALSRGNGSVYQYSYGGTQTDYLLNGSFEVAIGDQLASWKRPAAVQHARAKQICNKPEMPPVSTDGECAAILKGRAGQPVPKLTQVLSPVITAGLGAGDTLTLDICAKGDSVQAYTLNALKITYTGGGSDTISINWPAGTFDWSCQTGAVTLTGTPSKVQAVLVYPGSSGRITFDALVLTIGEQP